MKDVVYRVFARGISIGVKEAERWQHQFWFEVLRSRVLTKVTARVHRETDLSYKVIWCWCGFSSAKRTGFIRTANIELVIVLRVRGKFLSFDLQERQRAV